MSVRRKRTRDYLASREQVLAVMARIREEFLPLKPLSDQRLTSLLRASLHARRASGRERKAGRRSPWSPEMIDLAWQGLAVALERGTYSVGVTNLRFINHYLAVLDFPDDVERPLSEGRINLYEAAQLSRVADLSVRRAILSAHLRSGAAAKALKLRVDRLMQSGSVTPLPCPAESSRPEEADVDPVDVLDGFETDHLLYELAVVLASLFREAKPDSWTDAELNSVVEAGDRFVTAMRDAHLRACHRDNPPPEARAIAASLA